MVRCHTTAPREYVSRRSKASAVIPLNASTEVKILFAAAQLPGHLPAGLPVLHIWGGKDLSATPGVLSKMRETIAIFEEIELPDKGHWIMAEAKEEVTSAVLRWLSNKSRL
jgi:pimeloyl-ACP methyl ester carboxylesterase